MMLRRYHDAESEEKAGADKAPKKPPTSKKATPKKA